ncbi:hypothetical protein AURDEDRAFT_189126, partial [Auricularia subglabra TFB-10046 SS5]
MTRRIRTSTATTTCSMPSRSPAKASLGGCTLNEGPADNPQTSSMCDSNSCADELARTKANGIPELASARFCRMPFKTPESTTTQGTLSVQGSASRKDILSGNMGGAACASFTNHSTTALSAGAAQNQQSVTTPGGADSALGLVHGQLSARGGTGDNRSKEAANTDELAPSLAQAKSLNIASDARSTSSDTNNDASPTSSVSEGAHAQAGVAGVHDGLRPPWTQNDHGRLGGLAQTGPGETQCSEQPTTASTNTTDRILPTRSGQSVENGCEFDLPQGPQSIQQQSAPSPSTTTSGSRARACCARSASVDRERRDLPLLAKCIHTSRATLSSLTTARSSPESCASSATGDGDQIDLPQLAQSIHPWSATSPSTGTVRTTTGNTAKARCRADEVRA